MDDFVPRAQGKKLILCGAAIIIKGHSVVDLTQSIFYRIHFLNSVSLKKTI